LGRNEPKCWYWMALFFALGIWTKGPIIFGFGLGLFLWSLFERNFFYLKQANFYKSLLLLVAILLIPFLPSLRFDGMSVYEKFYRHKVSYLASSGNDLEHYFAYFELILQTTTLTILPFFATFWLLLKKKTTLSADSISTLKLVFFVALGIIIPLSFFRIKFPHYLLPFYPFFSIFAAPPIYLLYRRLQKWYPFNFPVLVKRLTIVTLCVFIALPIKTTGARTKEEINLINLIKLDGDIKNKDVYFYGVYEDNMTIFQSFKFYGSLDLRSLIGDNIAKVDLRKSYILINNVKLPIIIGNFNVTSANCFMQNETLCVVTDPMTASFIFPDKVFPHEVY
jgi:hypothetical protein